MKSNIDNSTFRKLIPEKVYELVKIISREGYSLTLIGGSVREFLLKNELGTDFDFELHHIFEFEETEWKSHIERLSKRLENIYHYQVEMLSFSIVRITFPEEGIDVELASPRIETYCEESPGVGHKDFKVQLKSKNESKEVFFRRDFTFNAIGISFHTPGTEDEFSFRDPLNGIDDLKNKVLNFCGPNFFKDPVRFCRLIRFSLKLNFSISVEIEKKLGQFNLSKLTIYYFISEWKKAKSPDFFKIFFNLVEKYSINLNDKILSLKYLEEMNYKGTLYSELGLLWRVVEKFHSRDISLHLANSLGYSLSKTKSLIIVFESLKYLSQLNEMKKRELKVMSYLDFKNHEITNQILSLKHVKGISIEHDLYVFLKSNFKVIIDDLSRVKKPEKSNLEHFLKENNLSKKETNTAELYLGLKESDF